MVAAPPHLVAAARIGNLKRAASSDVAEVMNGYRLMTSNARDATLRVRSPGMALRTIAEKVAARRTSST